MIWGSTIVLEIIYPITTTYKTWKWCWSCHSTVLISVQQVWRTEILKFQYNDQFVTLNSDGDEIYWTYLLYTVT